VTPADAVLRLLEDLERLGAHAWIDGGWGVDALLGEQTREHDDVDLVVHRHDVPGIRALLAAQGFEVERDQLPAALALRHPDGRAVDLHPVDPTADGGGDQQVGDDASYHYAAPVSGTIDGRLVRCCSVETQLETHLGYDADDDDRADMARPAERFGVSWPG
jgi:lincosamide nucleotidyltransferase A/C/D/E